jgi:hypothetical protein
MIKSLSACFGKSCRIESFRCAPEPEDQQDYDQINAMNLFYDMAVPTMIGLKGRYLMRQDLVNIHHPNFVTASNRTICLNLIRLQLNGMCRGDISADDVALAAAKRFAPLINTMLAPTTPFIKRMETMMEWAMEDPALHASFLYMVYDQLFANYRMQCVPSLRLGIPLHLIERHGSDEALRIWRSTAALARNHPSSFDRYRHFLEAVWLPYMAQHDPLAQAVLDELHLRFSAPAGAGDMPQAYMELGEAMQFSPSINLDSIHGHLTFSFHIHSKTLATLRHFEC